MMRILLIFGFSLMLLSTTAFAQKTVERYENGEKKYQGRTKDGLKIGTHTYWFEDGSKKREEKYDVQGKLILLREWNQEGELLKKENPEKANELLRVQQFNQVQWTEVNGGVSINKVKGELALEPILGMNNMIIHYASYLEDGTELDSSFRTKSPISIDLNIKRLIDGFQMGLSYFHQGDSGFIKVPAHLAYGVDGTTNVPPNSILIFQVLVLRRSE
ncbi:FKBP-type peptidyl-prolyl cis-trans isomerase [Fulvivirgaceae bacterium LMO-SS25]